MTLLALLVPLRPSIHTCTILGAVASLLAIGDRRGLPLEVLALPSSAVQGSMIRWVIVLLIEHEPSLLQAEAVVTKIQCPIPNIPTSSLSLYCNYNQNGHPIMSYIHIHITYLLPLLFFVIQIHPRGAQSSRQRHPSRACLLILFFRAGLIRGFIFYSVYYVADWLIVDMRSAYYVEKLA